DLVRCFVRLRHELGSGQPCCENRYALHECGAEEGSDEVDEKAGEDLSRIGQDLAQRAHRRLPAASARSSTSSIVWAIASALIASSSSVTGVPSARKTTRAAWAATSGS